MAYMTASAFEPSSAPSHQSLDGLFAQFQSEVVWITHFNSLPDAQENNPDNETVIPILQRIIDLMDDGMEEAEARAQAEIEFLTKGYICTFSH